jgi:His/Glu/Gln/Arg/opine family amino acid ABC transporter permease subunit
MAVQTRPTPRAPRVSLQLQALLGVAALLALMPLAFQMQARNFEVYGQAYAWRFLGQGLLVTLEVALLSILLSLPLATLFALGRLGRPFAMRWSSTLVIEGVRALPILLFIYFIGRGTSRSGVNLDNFWPGISGFWPVVVALTLYTTAVNAETIRAGILSLDRGQFEAAHSLGLSYFDSLRYVILPQAFRRVLPPLIAQFATLVKDTSLGYIVGLRELTRHGVIIFQGEYNPLETIYIVAIVYFVVNYVLGQTAQWIERRLQSDKRVTE